MLSHRLNCWLQVAVMTTLMSLIQHPFESTYWGAFQGRRTSNMRSERHKTSMTSTTYEETSLIDPSVDHDFLGTANFNS